ncbi:hypothetical protein Misp05_28900 [Micromonospora sp. NBRC 107095]|nr:hypothetical protein Misp05_28900 [Micromonospora sp. NBRC 107095]
MRATDAGSVTGSPYRQVRDAHRLGGAPSSPAATCLDPVRCRSLGLNAAPAHTPPLIRHDEAADKSCSRALGKMSSRRITGHWED